MKVLLPVHYHLVTKLLSVTTTGLQPCHKVANCILQPVDNLMTRLLPPQAADNLVTMLLLAYHNA